MIDQNAEAQQPPATAASSVDITAPDLTPAGPTDPAELDRLHERLVAAAAAEGSLDVAYRTVDSPLGLLLLAATEQGLVRLAYEREDHDQVLQALAAKVSPRILRAPGRLDDISRQLDDYFAGSRPASVDRCWTTCAPSATARRSPTLRWRPRPADPGRSGPWARRARPTRCRSSCPVIACCEPTAHWAVMSAAWGLSARCSRWNARFRCEPCHRGVFTL